VHQKSASKKANSIKAVPAMQIFLISGTPAEVKLAASAGAVVRAFGKLIR
jgi:hypothetical protein